MTGPGPRTVFEPRLPRLRLALARAALGWERLWPALWPALAIVGLFVVLALADLPPLLPGWAHLALLAVFAAALLAALWRGFARLRLPDAAAARRRLERDGGLAHRPLTGLTDRLAGPADAATAALWEAHQRRLAAEAAGIRLAPPRASLARHDPYGLRAALVLLLIVGLVGAREDAAGRLAAALSPDLAGFGRGTPASLDLWITPPAYTGMAPVFLTQGPLADDPGTAPAAPEPLVVPVGSAVMAQLHGGRGEARLVAGDSRLDFSRVDERTWRVEGRIEAGDRLAVEQGRTVVAAWPLTLLADEPPLIAFARPPAATERQALRLEYQATDDYGLERVRAVLRRADGGTGPGDLAAVEVPLPLPGVALKEAQAASYHDFTPHPWAGIAVEIRLEAEDAIGQRAASEPLTVILPEREFRHPVARAIVALRKRLTLAPEERQPVARDLQRLGRDSAAYDGDIVVALSLHVATRRLQFDRRPEAVNQVQELLWDTALRLEEGDLAVAERELRAAQQALQEALAGEATDEEIERLMDRLQQALDAFLAALAEQMAENREISREPPPFDPNATMLDREDLQRMLDRMREMARTGARDAAREMLAQLQEMLENLQAGPLGQPSSDLAEALEMLRDLESLSARQQQLLDRSFRQSQQMQPGDQAPNTEAEAAAQEALRQALGEIMRRLGEMTGEIPRPLGRAERAMEEAVGALGEGQPGAAVDPQSRALSELQQGARGMLEELMQALGQQPGGTTGPEMFGRMRDPLGRGESGMGAMDTGDVDVPDEAELQRAREILEELRRRAAERSRPKPERDYIDRLLRRF